MEVEQLISVIVPVYNVKKYLPRCVESIRRQTWSRLEILLVDDGSTDGSGALCEQMALTDARIKVIHKKNGGSSSARNVGLDAAHGEYIGFIDSDDYIEPAMYEHLLTYLMEQELNMVQISRDEIDESGIRQPDVCIPPTQAIQCDREQFLRELLLHRGDSSFCTKLTKACLFDDSRFPEGVLNEDFHLLLQMLGKVERIGILPEQAYHVFLRLGSNTRKKDREDFSRAFMDMIDNADLAEQIVAQHYPGLQEEVVRFALYQRLDYMLHIPVSRMRKEDAFYQGVKRYLRSHFWIMLRSRQLTAQNKKYLFVLTLAPLPVRRVHGMMMNMRTRSEKDRSTAEKNV